MDSLHDIRNQTERIKMTTTFREDIATHKKAVLSLSDHALRAIVADLRFNSTQWAKCRREAALNELYKRQTKKYENND